MCRVMPMVQSNTERVKPKLCRGRLQFEVWTTYQNIPSIFWPLRYSLACCRSPIALAWLVALLGWWMKWVHFSSFIQRTCPFWSIKILLTFWEKNPYRKKITNTPSLLKKNWPLWPMEWMRRIKNKHNSVQPIEEDLRYVNGMKVLAFIRLFFFFFFLLSTLQKITKLIKLFLLFFF